MCKCVIELRTARQTLDEAFNGLFNSMEAELNVMKVSHIRESVKFFYKKGFAYAEQIIEPYCSRCKNDN